MIAFYILLAAIVAGVVAYVVRSRRRNAVVRALATGHGWTYRPAASPAFTRSMSADPFHRGGRRGVTHLVEGELDGRAFRAFNYWLSVGRATEHWGVVATSIAAQLPAVTISRRAGGSHAVDALAVHEPLHTESELFNRMARITTDDPRTAASLLTPTVLALLQSRFDDLADVHLQGADVLVIGPAIESRTDLYATVEALCAFAAALPAFVLRERPLAADEQSGDVPS